jgi:hypothetical protein
MMRRLLVTIAAAVTLTLALVPTDTTPARADVYYPWCASYGGGDSPGVPVCSFMTQQQCLTTVQGTGGYCQQNWPPSSAPGATRRRF